MKSAPFVVVATLFLSSNLHSSSAFKHCPTDRGYRWVGSYCLRFVKNKVSWYSASDVCKKEGGHLLRLENLSKMTYLIDWMNNNKLWDWYWVDGKDNHDYNFRWSSNGGQVGSNLWAALEPNHAFGSGQFCAHFYTWVKQGLGDSGCTYYNLPYICENESENGEWGYWGSWSSCSLSCGSGRQSRYRFCDNPKPKGLGATCPGSSHGTQTCNTQPCPVDGAWAAWAGWTLCSKTCGGGTMIRSRTCTNPKPNYGGKDCAQGNAAQTIQCNENDCPIDGAWADWASWTTCTRTCGGGTMMRTRTCTNPKPQHGGKDCIRGNATQTMECNKNGCPIDGAWADWEDWSQCTMTCGGGTMMRTRTCTNPRPQHGGKDCLKGNATQTMECNKNDCPIDGAWADWAGWNPCTRTCGGGTMMRSRTCTNPCTRTCGGGTMMRSRTCTNPKPQHGGKDCIRGNATQVTQCNLRDCPTCLLHDVPGTSRSVPGLRLKENESVRYYCLPEYKLVGGNEVRTCEGNGSLSNEEPKCTKCCGKARYIPNGFPDVPSGLCFGDSVTYQCESGYKPSNDTPITCMSPYAWPYLELPKCEADGNCNSSAIAGPAGGYKACPGSDTDKVCYMHCSNGKTYTSEQNLFECGAKTGWEWKVPMRGGNNHLRGTVGACEVSDDPAGLLMFLEGCDLTLQTSELTEALKEEIRNEMMKELAAMNLCSDPCQIRDIEIETIANGYR